MRRFMCMGLLALVFAVFATSDVFAGHRHRHNHWGGYYDYYDPFPFPFFYSPPPVYAQPRIVVVPSPPAYAPPIVVLQPPAPQVYVQQPQAEVQAWRWWCPDPKGFHPDVPECNVNWKKVIP